MFFWPSVSKPGTCELILTQYKHVYCCGLKFQWALMSLPSSISSLDCSSSLPFSEHFPLQTPGSINIKIFRNNYFQKKSANCIIFSVFNNILQSDLPSQIINLLTKMPHSETSCVILRNLPQRHCKQEVAFPKTVLVTVHEIYFLSQCKRKLELNKTCSSSFENSKSWQFQLWVVKITHRAPRELNTP